jgi:hypothetical protein
MSVSEIDKPAAKKFTLTVQSADAEAEIFLIDGEFQMVARDVGHLQAEVEPGIYKVKYRTGAATSEQLVLVKDQPVVVSLARLSFSSPAPLAETAKTHEYHMAGATEESRKIHVKSGTGSWIFVFVRDWTVTGNSVRSGNPSQWLSLHDEQGTQIADLHTAGTHSVTGDPWAACNLEVGPGTYRLRLDLPAKNGQRQVRLEQAIVASPGWQTQVFLLRKAYGPEQEDWAADLAGAAILLSRGLGFDPSRADFRQTELARLGLTNRRRLISEEIQQMLRAKMENPMLGILGAHLLLLRPQIDKALLEVVVQNLRNLLGETHPDVEAIALQLENGTSYAFSSPPMLRRSWALLVEATTSRSMVIVPNSLAARIWDRLWAEEPWLLWEVPEALTTGGAKGLGLESQLEGENSALVAALREYVLPRVAPMARPTSSPFAAVMKMQSSATVGLNEKTLDILADVSSTKGPVGTPPQVRLEDEKVNALSRTLAIPEETLRKALNQIYGKNEDPAEEFEK